MVYQDGLLDLMVPYSEPNNGRLTALYDRRASPGMYAAPTHDHLTLLV